jgi:hypothetical protein
MPSENRFTHLSPHAVLKNLEEHYLYDIEKDELYELNEDGYGRKMKNSSNFASPKT